MSIQRSEKEHQVRVSPEYLKPIGKTKILELLKDEDLVSWVQLHLKKIIALPSLQNVVEPSFTPQGAKESVDAATQRHYFQGKADTLAAQVFFPILQTVAQSKEQTEGRKCHTDLFAFGFLEGISPLFGDELRNLSGTNHSHLLTYHAFKPYVDQAVALCIPVLKSSLPETAVCDTNSFMHTYCESGVYKAESLGSIIGKLCLFKIIQSLKVGSAFRDLSHNDFITYTTLADPDFFHTLGALLQRDFSNTGLVQATETQPDNQVDRLICQVQELSSGKFTTPWNQIVIESLVRKQESGWHKILGTDLFAVGMQQSLFLLLTDNLWLETLGRTDKLGSLSEISRSLATILSLRKVEMKLRVSITSLYKVAPFSDFWQNAQCPLDSIGYRSGQVFIEMYAKSLLHNPAGAQNEHIVTKEKLELMQAQKAEGDTEEIRMQRNVVEEVQARNTRVSLALYNERALLQEQILHDPEITKYLQAPLVLFKQLPAKQAAFAELSARTDKLNPVFEILLKLAQGEFKRKVKYPGSIGAERYFDIVTYAACEELQSFLGFSAPELAKLSDKEALKKLTEVVQQIMIAVRIVVSKPVMQLLSLPSALPGQDDEENYKRHFLQRVDLPSYEFGKYIGKLFKVFLAERLDQFSVQAMPLQEITAISKTSELAESKSKEPLIIFKPKEDEVNITPEHAELVNRFFNKLTQVITGLVEKPEEVIKIMNQVLGPVSMGFQINAVAVSPIDFASFMYSREALDVYIFDLLYRAKKAILMGQLHARLYSSGHAQQYRGMAGLYEMMKHIGMQEQAQPFDASGTIVTPQQAQKARVESIGKIAEINMHLFTLQSNPTTEQMFNLIIKPAQEQGIFTLEESKEFEDLLQLIR